MADIKSKAKQALKNLRVKKPKDYDLVKICINGARNLKTPKSKTVSPFCLIRFGGCVFTTAPANSTNPTWNETAVFKIPANETFPWIITVEVWNENVKELWAQNIVASGDFLGSTDISSSWLTEEGVSSITQSLSVGDNLIGELSLELHCVSASEIAEDPVLLSSSQQLKKNAKNSNTSATTSKNTEHRKMHITTIPLFRTCSYCGDVCWGVALQAYTCSDCRQAYHRRCQQAGQETPCVIGGDRRRKKSAKDREALESLDIAKKKKRMDKCVHDLSSTQFITDELLLEFMTWAASDFQTFGSDQYFNCLHAKRVSVGTLPLVLESLLAKDIFAKLSAIQVIQRLLYDDTNKRALMAKDGVSVLIQAMRDMQTHFLHAVSSLNRSGRRSTDDNGSPSRVNHVSPHYELFIQHLLGVLTFLSNDDSRVIIERDGGLEILLDLCRFFGPSDNETVRRCLGALLIQFCDNEQLWPIVSSDENQDALRLIVNAAEQGVATLHKEILPSEVELVSTVFQSPLCEVVRARWKGMDVALKLFDINSIAFSWEAFFREVAMLSIAQHTNVVKLYGANSNRHAKRPFVVMEYCEAGTIEDVVNRAVEHGGRCMLNELFAVNIGLDLASGLAHLHRKGIIHRDVKSANFLVDQDNRVKMIDFGVSKMQEYSKMMTKVGTPIWMAPEVLTSHGYTEKADIYGFALIIYHLLSGEEPYNDMNPLLVLDHVGSGHRPQLPKNTTPALKDLLERCWQTDDKKRPSATELVIEMEKLRQILLDQSEKFPALPADVASKIFRYCDFTMQTKLLMTCRRMKTLIETHRITSLVPMEKLDLDENHYDSSLKKYVWFHDGISKDQANAMLFNMPPGSFIVRPSSLPGRFVLCGMFDKKLLHILISPVTRPYPGYSIDIAGDNRIYPTIVKLVKVYHHVLKAAICRPEWTPKESIHSCLDMPLKPIAAPKQEHMMEVLADLAEDTSGYESEGSHFSPRGGSTLDYLQEYSTGSSFNLSEPPAPSVASPSHL